MSTVLNLTPLADDVITLKKFEREISFPDRLPASLLPALLAMQTADGGISLTPENITRLFQIISRLILRANPDLTEDEVLDFLDVQDLGPITQALLNPQEPSSETTTEPTPMRAPSRRETRKPRE